MEWLVFLGVALTTTSTTVPLEAKTSLAIVSDDEAWRESGFRVGLGYAYDSVIGQGGAPDGPHHTLMVRLGARLDANWSLFAGLRYGAKFGQRPGLRYSGTVEPTLHLHGLELTAGLGIAGFVIAQTGLEGYSAGNIVASYTVPDDRAQLSACSGAGVLGLLRLEYPVPINDLLAIGPVLQVEAQWTRCTQTLGRSDPDTGEGIELHQYWGHYNIGLGVDDVVALSAYCLLLAGAVPEVPTSSTATVGFVAPRLRYAPVLVPPTITTITSRQVSVRIRVDLEGAVERVTLTQSGGLPFDEVVLHGAAHFSFFPGRFNGAPVPVDIQYNQNFPPQLPLVATSTRPPMGRLAGELIERGTRRPLAFATVLITAGAEQLSTSSDEAGRFEVELPAGEVRVQILATGNRAFVQREDLVPDQRLEVRYLVDPERRHPYEIVVTDRLERTEIAQTVLRGPELKQVPGTFGDPFRVVGTLPGVSSMMSLLPFPIVRGSSPGNTGFLIDGVRVPLLFHLLAGPSIIHPELIDSIEFAPGAFGVDYGGYTGGIVDGKTRPARSDERRVDLDLNLFQAGGLVREPFPSLGGTVTVAGRYGFPGLILSLASPRVSLQYFDYQARYDRGDAKNGYSIFVFGAYDALDSVPTGLPDNAPKEPLLQFQFHRLDLQYRHRGDNFGGQYLLSLGYDGSLSQEEATLDSLSATPRLRWSLGLLDQLELRFGLDGLFRQATFTTGVEGAGEVAELLGLDGEPSNALYSLGGLAELVWRPNADLVVRPGVRVDGFHDGLTGQVGVDPRLSARYRLWDDEQTVWVKAGVGLYHQPPRFAIPVPGLDQIAFEKGLLESAQTTVGAELSLGAGWTVDLQTYFNWMDPILYDVQINPNVDEVLNPAPSAPPGMAPAVLPEDTDGLNDRLDRLLAPATGRSYGAELLLRRQSDSGITGWLSYTFSRSERSRDERWISFDFDRTHLLNLVASFPLPRSWQLGLRAQVQSGRPLTTTSGLAEARTATFVRFDLRIDKTAIWNDWLLDFYIDISNAILGGEELAPENTLRYVIPTVGFRGLF